MGARNPLHPSHVIESHQIVVVSVLKYTVLGT